MKRMTKKIKNSGDKILLDRLYNACIDQIALRTPMPIFLTKSGKKND